MKLVLLLALACCVGCSTRRAIPGRDYPAWRAGYDYIPPTWKAPHCRRGGR